nr:3-hydroxyacyl-CoA dehydrogenase NAD-binding domain-containing protein [uncultured Brevundimonas sp.]
MPIMNETVTTRIDGGVGVILCDNPPVNALSHPLRQDILFALEALLADGVDAIVLACEGRTFFAGADITEFGKPRRDPTLQDVVRTLEASPVPVIAAIHGTALGGGFEVALGCHYRVMRSDAVVGLPEIKLGLFAGGGGTKRLPRLIGPEAALELCLSGDRIPAERALELGIVDKIESDDLVRGAIGFARTVIGQPVTPVRDREDKIAATRADPSDFEARAAKLTARTAGQEAPAANVQSIRESFTLSFDEGLERDAVENRRLMAGAQSRALRHLFFAEREAAKIPGVGSEAKPREIRRAAVVGAGTMGGGIAMAFAAAGVPVVLLDASEEGLSTGLKRVQGNYAASVKRGSVSAEEVARRLGLIEPTTDRAAVADVDLVIEAVFEDMALKKELFSDIEQRVRPGVVLASNTSALDIDEIASVLERPEDFVGMHFFSPANVMRLLEVVQGARTSPTTIVTAMAIGRRIGKIPVWSGNCDGFIGNRMVAKRSAQAERLLQRGALPAEVDGALTALGFPMGPLTTNDMSGLDVGYAIRKRRGTPFPIADAIVESGRLGQKTGAGYYRYDPGDRTPRPNPEVEALILETSQRLGIERRTFPREEIAERLLYPLINEGARILEEGIALRPSDIDLVWVNGYGWPRHLGGPMFYADEAGLGRVVERLEAFRADTDDPSLEPAPLLRDLAASGSSFGAWQSERATSRSPQ